MKFLILLINFLIFCPLLIQSQGVPKVKCPLEWASPRIDGSIPSNAVESHASKHIIIAAKSLDTSITLDVLGRYDVVSKKALAVSNSNQIITTREFKFLLNPNNCTLEWIPAFDNEDQMEKFGVHLNSTNAVGRFGVAQESLSGSINTESLELIGIDKNNNVKSYDNHQYQILLSYHKGLDMKMVKITYQKDPFTDPTLEVIGLDVIKNEMDAEVSFTVVHSRMVENSYYFWERREADISCRSPLGLWSSSIKMSTESETNEENALNFTVVKTITVAPYESVEVCTVVEMSDHGFSTEYNAFVEFSAKGLTTEEVEKHIRNELDNDENYLIEGQPGGVVFVTFNSTIKGSITSSAKTRVLPLGSQTGCVIDLEKKRENNGEMFKERKKQLDKNRKSKVKHLLDRETRQMNANRNYLNTITFTLYTNTSGTGKIIKLGSDEDYSLLPDQRKTVFVTHGFTSNDGAVKEIATQIMDLKQDYNAITVDWSRLAAPIFYDSSQDWVKLVGYPIAAKNTRLTGEAISLMLRQLVDSGKATYANSHIIGHSLGGHVAGHAGAFLNGKVGRITGLDPAGPLFTGVCFNGRLDATDGRNVDVIHTNGGDLGEFDLGLGYKDPLGHVDFYPNGGQKQACSGFSCSHEAAVKYMTNSIIKCKNENNACSCLDWDGFPGNCDCLNTKQMGFYSNGGAGKYYLSVLDNDSCGVPVYNNFKNVSII